MAALRKWHAWRVVPWVIEGSSFDYCMIEHERDAFHLETIADLARRFRHQRLRDRSTSRC
jgi:hypothetical protein